MTRVATKEKAQDVVQETFARVWQYVIEGNSILHEKSFLYTIAHHLIIDEYRKKKTISLEGIINTYEEPSVTLEENDIDKVELSHVMDCINELSPMYRSVLTLRYVDDLSIKSIASVIHISESAVSVRINRGLLKVRHHMKSFL